MTFNSNKLLEGWIPDLPSIYQIEVASRCNLSCQFCQTGLHYGAPLSPGSDFIKPSLFYTIIDRDLGGSSFIELQYRGEPTLNKNLVHYVNALRNKVFVGFSTHGGLLHIAQALQAALNSHYVTISIDSGHKERYEKLRLGGCWERLLTNIDLLVKEKGKNFFPVIDLQLIEFEGFELEVELVARLCQERGWMGKTIRIRTVKDTQAPWTQHYHASAIDQLCTNPWYSVSIKANGDVVPCCMTFEDNEEMTYGNLYQQSLKEIWQSSKVEEFRYKHRHDHNLPLECQKCYARSPHNLHQNLMNDIVKLSLLDKS